MGMYAFCSYYSKPMYTARYYVESTNATAEHGGCYVVPPSVTTRLLGSVAAEVNITKQQHRNPVQWATKVQIRPKKCLIGITRSTLHIFINFSKTKKKTQKKHQHNKIKSIFSLSFPVTHVCAGGSPLVLYGSIFNHFQTSNKK